MTATSAIKKDNTPTLYTERLILRKYRLSDLDDIFPLYSDTEVNVFLPWFPHETKAETEKYLKGTIMAEYEKDIAYCYAIATKETDTVIGYITIHDICEGAKSADLGYALKKEFWNKGIVTEACTKILEHLKNMGFSYLTATHDVNNDASGAVMKKIGMTYRYSYVEQVQPKNITVTFRMYQINFDGDMERVYNGYWDKYPIHFIEKI